MARPLSADKRNAILAAAAALVASDGLGAPTSKIARAAGVAEGTIFTYFTDKDALLNELFVDLKHQLLRATLARHTSGPLVGRARQFWNRYVDWGVSFPAQRRTLRQLAVSEVVTRENKLAGRALFAQIDGVLERALRDGGPRALPIDFAGAIMITLAETTIDSIEHQPGRRRALTRAGFQAFWNAITGSIQR